MLGFNFITFELSNITTTKMSKYTEDDLKLELETKEYEYGFYTELDAETFPIGLNEDIVRAISLKKNEPQWMTDWRIEAFRAWELMTEPEWANVTYEKPDFQAISYYSAPKSSLSSAKSSLQSHVSRASHLAL